MNEQDLSDLYKFIKHLGDGGEQLPEALPPGAEPKTPYINYVPQNLPAAKNCVFSRLICD